MEGTEIVFETETPEAVEATEISTEVGEVPVPGDTDTLQSIDNKLGIVVLLLLFSFCWSCMRHWRNNVLKGV